ncbi:MAG: response regulator [Anaerolineales bacterium]|nr:response regulator [Anaerolineales bacterium]
MSAGQPLVLCVEDDLRTLDILIKVLGRLPVRQAAAREARTAIELAGRLQPELLILDLMLPGLTGWQVLEAIRQGPHHPGMRVLVLSAKDSSAERLLATNVARVEAFMSKPFDIAELARRILKLLELPVDADWPGLDPAAGDRPAASDRPAAA